MITYSAGTAVLIEKKVKKAIPFAADEFYDPVSISIEFFNDQGTSVSSGTMTKYDTGKYTYTLQTGTDWETGIYSSVLTIGDTLGDVIVEQEEFYLG